MSGSDRILDDKVLKALESRDPKFLESLFVEVNPFLLRVCIANGIFKNDANDIIHQTWETFFSNLAQFEGRSQLKTYICGILFNKVREFRRANKKILLFEDSENVASTAFTEDGWWNNKPTDPHRILELKQASHRVQECMEGLSEQQKVAFVLRIVDEEEPKAICDVLGIGSSHLRVLLFRAKEKLRLCLEGSVAAEQS